MNAFGSTSAAASIRNAGGRLKHRDEMAEDLGVSSRLFMQYLRQAGCVSTIHEHVETFPPFPSSRLKARPKLDP
jgi:hypothetical protein